MEVELTIAVFDHVPILSELSRHAKPARPGISVVPSTITVMNLDLPAALELLKFMNFGFRI